MGADIRRMAALREPCPETLKAEIDRARHPLRVKPDLVQPLRHALQEAMWEDVGVMRTETGMKRGLRRVAEISEALMTVGVAGDDLAYNLTWHDWLNLRSLCDISEAITLAAVARENSRGAHYREDFPEEGDLDASYFTVVTAGGSGTEVRREPVRFSLVRPGETILPEGEPETLVAAQ